MAIFVQTAAILSGSVTSIAAENPDSTFSALRRLRDQIQTAAYTQSISAEDQWVGKPVVVSTQTVRIEFNRPLRRAKRTLLSGLVGPSSSSPTLPNTVQTSPTVFVVTQEQPDPAGIFSLPELVAALPKGVRTKGNGVVVEIGKSQRRGGPPPRRIELNAAGAPIHLETLGASGRSLDIVDVRWQSIGDLRFPREIIIIQRSRQNTVTTTIRYSDVVLNQAIDTSDWGGR